MKLGEDNYLMRQPLSLSFMKIAEVVDFLLFANFHKDWIKIVDFLLMANFWTCPVFFTQTLVAVKFKKRAQT